MLSKTEQPGTPDDWLALNDAERAEVARRARDYEPDGIEPVLLVPVTESVEPNPVPAATPAKPASVPTLVDAMESAESLEPDDRMRLIAWLWETMPPKNRAAIIAFGLENMHSHADDEVPEANEQPVDPIWPKVWDALFNPAKTSELYSAPRRFDLATIFVVTAAYSLLFGALTALDFDPVTKVAVGLLVTIVAGSQALYQHVANPRGVSIVAGAVTQSIFVAMLGIFVRRWQGEPLLLVVLFYGLICGAISGYLAGVLVGGVFLVADALRGKFENRSKTKSDDISASDAD